MKKILMSLAIVIASIGAVEMRADNTTQSQNNTPTVCASTANPDGGCCKGKKGKDAKKGKKGDKKGKKGNKRGCCCGNSVMSGITLTPDQQTKYNKLRDDRKEKIQKVKDDSKKKMMKISDDFDQDLKKILTPAQYAQYQNNKANMKKGEKKGHRGEAGHVKGMKKGPKGKNFKQGDGRVGPIVPGPRPQRDTEKR